MSNNRSTIDRNEPPRSPEQASAPAEQPRQPRRKRLKHAIETAGKFIIQLAFLIGVCYLGNAISAALPIDIPGNIVSMVLLLTLLITGMLQATKIDLVSSFLLKYMPVFFIPAGVSVMGCFPMISDRLPEFALVVFLTTVLVFMVTSFTVTAVIELQAKIAEKKGEQFDTSIPFENDEVFGEFGEDFEQNRSESAKNEAAREGDN